MKETAARKRIKAIRLELKSKGGRCIVVSNKANVTYVTGFTGGDSWAVLTPRTVYLVTDSRYTEQAKGECTGCRIIERNGSMAGQVARLLGTGKSTGTILVESCISVAEFEQLRKKSARRVRAVSNVVESIRAVKDAGEVAAIGSAVAIAEKALGRVRAEIRRGVTENELAGRLELEIRRLAGRPAFETIVAFGANGSRPHHRPSNRRLRKNDTILIDFGVRYKGYCCDLTRCFAVGRASGLFDAAYGAVERAQQAAIAKIRPEAVISEVDAAARAVIDDYGLPVYGHGTGHGLGLEVHELPIISGKIKEKLQAGQVLTIEPGVYIPGKLGVRLEDDILVTQTGCRVLSGSVKPKNA